MGSGARSRAARVGVTVALVSAAAGPATWSAAAPPPSAASWEGTLKAADGRVSDLFGDSVAISGDTVVVGAVYQDAGGFNNGAAYVYVREAGGWRQDRKLTADDAAHSDFFGAGVAVSDDTVVVGAPGDDDRGSGAGSAYVFTRTGTGWQQVAKLTAPDGAAGDRFGEEVAVSGDTVVVGAILSDSRQFDAGAAYVFRRSGAGWTYEATLTAADAAYGDNVGAAVAVSPAGVLVGAPGDDAPADLSGRDVGSAHLFVRGTTGWRHEAEVVAPDGQADDLFGVEVSLSRETAVVGALGNDGGAENAGSAYVLRRVDGRWRHEATLRGEADPGDFFGRAVAIDGDAALVGASGDDSVVRDSGAVYAFERRDGQWVRTVKLTTPTEPARDALGVAVAVDETRGVVGAPLASAPAAHSGAAHVVTGLADFHPPRITAEVRAPANDAGWHHEVPVTVVFHCSDAGSGVAECTSPVEARAEPGTTVTGRAVDQAGNEASLDVVVRIDTTPPRLSVDDPAPVPGLPVPAAAITGAASDALSGLERVGVVFTHAVTSASETRRAVRDGGSWRVSTAGLPPGPTVATVTATDVAGNVSPPSTLRFIALR